jgi:hypothetical protein
MNLFVYWEYAEGICKYIEETQRARKVDYLCEFATKIENIFKCLLGGQMSPFGQTTLIKKILCMCTFKHV